MLSFPLSHADFLDRLPVSRLTFDPPEQVEIAQDGGGGIWSADLAPRLWQGEISLGKLLPPEEADAMALIDVLRDVGASALIYDLRRPWPQADRGGLILGASAPVIQSLASSGQEMALAGLPAGYVLTRGDYLGWDYLGRRAVHKVVDLTVAAGGSGITPTFQVVPAIRPGSATGAAVRLTKVSCKARLVPGSASPGSTTHRLTEGITFGWCQTLRAG